MAKTDRDDAPPCGGSGCFNGATYEVIPRGRWRNVQITKACRKCVKAMAAAYETKGVGERGWADIEPIKTPIKPAKPDKSDRRSEAS